MSTARDNAPFMTSKLGALLVLLAIAGAAVVWLWDDAPAEEEAGPRDFRTTLPAPAEDEDLEGTIQRLLDRVVNGDAALESELERDLLAALNREEVGIADRREEAAQDVVAQMVAAAAQFEGEHSGSDEMRQRALRQQTTTLVRELYAATAHREAETPASFGPRPEGYRRMIWDELTEIDYREGDPLPEEVLSLDGERVAMAGFLVEAGYDELLLVRSVWSCCFGRPPEMQEAVVVTVEGEAEDEWFDGVVRVVGTLEVGEEYEDDYLVSIYRMRASQVDVLR